MADVYSDEMNLVDILDISIDEKLTKEERALEFIKKIKNPYFFKCGKLKVRVKFADTSITLEDRLVNYFGGN